MYIAVKKGNIFGQYFTSENIHRKLLSLINLAVYLLNNNFVASENVATAPELCQNAFFLKKRMKEILLIFWNVF